MLGYLTVIFCCQLMGEFLVSFLALPIPGPVAGMMLLFSGLMWCGLIPEDLGKVADGLLANFSLLFIPAGVGIMSHAGLIGRDWLSLSVSLLLSTAAAILVTGWMMARLTQRAVAIAGDDT